MANEQKEIQVKVGIKLSDAEVNALDPKDVGRMVAQPNKPAVEGQLVMTYVWCPYCGCMGVMTPGPPGYLTCHCCGYTIRA